MEQTIQALLAGDDNIATYYRKTKEKWLELFVAKKDSPLSAWAKWLGDEQPHPRSNSRMPSLSLSSR
jgi:hypothetical protein